MGDTSVQPASGQGPAAYSPVRVPEQPERRSLAEMMADAKERAKQNKDRFSIKKSGRYGEVTIEAYGRLSRARTRGDVSSAAGYARRQIARLKQELRGDGENASRIRAAIGQLQKAVLRAGRKTRELGREQLQEQQQERAQEQARQREALRLRQELNRRRALRLIREGGYISEAAIDDRMQAELARAAESNQLPGGAATPAPVPGAVQTATQQYVAAMTPEVAAAPTFTAQA